VFAGLAIAGMLLAPATASALPPLPGDKDADGVSDHSDDCCSVQPQHL
jgi:hypothetical protein